MRRALAAAVLFLALPAAHGQNAQALSLTLPDGSRIVYRLRSFSPDSQALAPGAKLAPTNALNTARLLLEDLAVGRIEDAALLSNAPKQRYRLLREAYTGWKREDFARAYGRYFLPQNGVVAEASIGEHHLVIWRLKDIDYLAGYFFMDIDGKTYLDDWPSPVRAQLQQLLEAFRAGKLPPP